MDKLPDDKKKFIVSTDTDLHFEKLADRSKLKMAPNLINSLNTKKSYNDDTSDSDIEEHSNTNIEANMDEFNKKKAFHDFKKKFGDQKDNNLNKIEEDDTPSSESSTKKSTIKSSKNDSNREKTPNIHELKNLDEVPFHMLDSQTQKFKKMEKYAQLLTIKNSGIKLTKDYSLHSDYDEMSFEVEYWNNYKKKTNGVSLGKSFLTNAITAIEFMNDRYDPFSLKLNGWSEQVQVNSDSYDNVMGELYDKYKSSGKKMQPEIKLILMIAASAASFHASKKMAESIPGLDNVLKQNPELLSKIQNVINTNISGKGKQETTEDKRQKMYDQMQKIKQQQNKFEELKKKQQEIQSNNERIKKQMDNMNKPAEPVLKRQQPANIGNILNRIKAQNVARKADEALNMSESTDSDNRVSLDSNIGNKELNESYSASATLTVGSDGATRRRGRKKKPTISIAT